MYILFNERGELTTAIPHGQIVRQGNAFDMYVCFPNKAQFGNLSPIAEFKVDGAYRMMGVNDYECWGKPITFHPVEENEAVFDFVDGHKYMAYHIEVKSGATVDHGELPFIVSVVMADGVERQGKGTINVLSTYGSDDREETSGANVDFLLSEMKKGMLLYSYGGVSAQPTVFSAESLFVNQWKTIGFVSGSFRMLMDVSQSDGDDAEEGYAKVAYFDGASGVLCPSTIFGHDQNGEDVELRVYEDRDGRTSLAVNIDSAIETYDVINVVGIFSSKMAPEQDTDGLIVQDEETESLSRIVLVEGEIGSDLLGANAVTTAKIANGAVTTDKIGYRAVTADKIVGNAVNTSSIAPGAVTSDRIQNYAVTSNKIANNAVTEGKIADGAITEGKIANNAVTSDKIADGSVTYRKIGDGAIGLRNLDYAAMNLVDYLSGELEIDISNYTKFSTALNKLLRGEDGYGFVFRFYYDSLTEDNYTYTMRVDSSSGSGTYMHFAENSKISIEDDSDYDDFLHEDQGDGHTLAEHVFVVFLY